MTRKKTLYEILGVPPSALPEEIRVAHQRELQVMREDGARFSQEELDFQKKILSIAFNTLMDPVSRNAYDAKLSASAELTSLPVAAVNPELLSRRADVMALRADSMALRADTMSAQMGLSPAPPAPELPPSFLARVQSGLESSFRRVLLIIGALALLSMLAQATFTFFSMRNTEKIAREQALAEEQLVIQDHYLKYGVRPASAAEARLLEREHMRKEEERREAERQQRIEDEKARRFEEESRRLGREVSAKLQAAEERVRYEEARERQRQEDALQRKEYEEQRRQREQQARWDRIIHSRR